MLSSSLLPSAHLSTNFAAARRRSTSSRVAAPCAATTNRAMSAAAAPSSLYGVLGLSIGAGGDEIKAAYRKLALTCHPDVCKGSSSSGDEFMKIHAAYLTLSDPNMRADYDRGLVVSRQHWPGRTQPASQAVSGCGRRTWETDQCW